MGASFRESYGPKSGALGDEPRVCTTMSNLVIPALAPITDVLLGDVQTVDQTRLYKHQQLFGVENSQWGVLVIQKEAGHLVLNMEPFSDSTNERFLAFIDTNYQTLFIQLLVID